MDNKPVLWTTFKSYTKERFFKDLMAGIIVGIVALPLAIAFGIASGVSPEKGLITAVIRGFIVSFLGGSTVQIGGPTGAFIIVVYGIVQNYGTEGLTVATLMAGVFLLLMGIFKLGSVIRFIPYPIVVGFTSGIAVTIFSTQIKDLFGMQIENIPAGFISKWGVYFENIGTVSVTSLVVGLLSIAIIMFFPRVSRKIPGSLVAIVLMTLAVYLYRRFTGDASIETIGDRFVLGASLPHPEKISINMSTINQLLSSAFTIAMLGAIESLLSATVADGVTGKRHNSNTELIAQGVANMVVPIFGGIPVTGAIARTMTNINNGGRTPVAGIIHAVVLLLILLFLGPLTKHIPMACLAGVLIIVAYNMSEWRTFLSLGLLLAMLMFMRRMVETTKVSVLKDAVDLSHESDIHEREEILVIPENVEVYEIDGPFFFGVASKFDECMKQMGDKPKVRIIRMRKVPFMDSIGLHNLENLYRLSASEGIKIVLSGVNKKVLGMLEKCGLAKKIGHQNICGHIDQALERAGDLST